MDVVNSSKINISEDNKIKEILNSSDANTLKKDDTSKSIPILKRDNLEISPIINKTQEKENENLSLKIKQKYFPMATEMMGLGKETGQELAKLDTYTLIKEGIHALGVKEDVSEDIATKFSKRQFDKTLNTIGLKALEIVPTKLIDLELRKNLTQEITESISKNLTNSGKSIKLNAKSASVIVKAIEK